MARLTEYHLALEIKFLEVNPDDWSWYGIRFLWVGQPLLGEDLLEPAASQRWGPLPPGTVVTPVDDADELVRSLEKVLETNEADYWESLEWDIRIAIYPEERFPFLESHWKLVKQAEERRLAILDREKRKAEAGGKLPDDLIQIVALVDTYHLKRPLLEDIRGPSWDGPALAISTTRESLEAFTAELRREYEQALERHRNGHVEPVQPDTRPTEPLTSTADTWKMVRRSYYLPPDVHKLLKKYSEESHLTESELVRRILYDWLDEEQDYR